MATGNQIAEVRRAADVPTDDPVHTVDVLTDIIDSTSTLYRAILKVWIEKAAGYSSMASMSEAGSSRSLGELHDNALEMIKLYTGLVAAEDATAATATGRPFSVPITRA